MTKIVVDNLEKEIRLKTLEDLLEYFLNLPDDEASQLGIIRKIKEMIEEEQK